MFTWNPDNSTSPLLIVLNGIETRSGGFRGSAYSAFNRTKWN